MKSSRNIKEIKCDIHSWFTLFKKLHWTSSVFSVWLSICKAQFHWTVSTIASYHSLRLGVTFVFHFLRSTLDAVLRTHLVIETCLPTDWIQGSCWTRPFSQEIWKCMQISFHFCFTFLTLIAIYQFHSIIEPHLLEHLLLLYCYVAIDID